MSRTKSDKKRSAIIQAAKDLFLKYGFSDVSMDKVSQLANVSKNTLYDHFQNKQLLFSQVLLHHWQTNFVPRIDIHDEREIEVVLTQFSKEFINYLYQEDTMALFRTLITESGRFPELANSLVSQNETPIRLNLMRYLTEQISKKKMKKCNTSLAANHFFGLLKEDAFWHVMLGFREKCDAKEINTIINTAIEVFISHYL